jgi:hypothetical protein
MNKSTFFILLLIAQFSLISMASIKRRKIESSDTTKSASSLSSNMQMKNGESLVSPNGKYRLTQEWSGNLKVYSVAPHNGKSVDNELWASASGDNQKAPYVLIMKADGNLVTNNHIGNQYWSSVSKEKGQGPFKVTMQDDGNCVIYDSKNKALWSTETSGRQ